MQEHIFTFGFGHYLANCYTVIKAETAEQAREKMFEKYGRHWAFQYPSREAAGADRFDMREVPFGTPNEKSKR